MWQRSQGDVPTSVGNLLVATKQLEEALRQWSVRRASDNEVSDTYVTVGTEFNNMINAFAQHQIDLRWVLAPPLLLSPLFPHVPEPSSSLSSFPITFILYQPMTETSNVAAYVCFNSALRRLMHSQRNPLSPRRPPRRARVLPRRRAVPGDTRAVHARCAADTVHPAVVVEGEAGDVEGREGQVLSEGPGGGVVLRKLGERVEEETKKKETRKGRKEGRKGGSWSTSHHPTSTYVCSSANECERVISCIIYVPSLSHLLLFCFLNHVLFVCSVLL